MLRTFLIISLCYHISIGQESCCDGEWTEIYGRCYQLVTDPPKKIQWEDAVIDCVIEGGTLAALHSLDETTAVREWALDQHDYTRLHLGMVRSDWIDGEARFHWINGEPFYFIYWGSNSPSYNFTIGTKFFDEKCIGLMESKVWLWNDYYCPSSSEIAAGLCQKDCSYCKAKFSHIATFEYQSESNGDRSMSIVCKENYVPINGTDTTVCDHTAQEWVDDLECQATSTTTTTTTTIMTTTATAPSCQNNVTTDLCPQNWTQVHYENCNGTEMTACYKLMRPHRYQLDAERNCSAEVNGSHLASILCEDENIAIMELIMQYDFQQTWIGGVHDCDEDFENEVNTDGCGNIWMWIDGKGVIPLTNGETSEGYANWKLIPNTEQFMNRDCMQIADHFGQWNQCKCGPPYLGESPDQQQSVCKIEIT